MSSILTNNGAMVALQTLRSINQNLTDTQNQISTGKNVANAGDNAAVWAISKVMESDVQSFMGISDSLALGESTVAVARQASETVTDLLTEMKTKIVAAQEENVDRSKIQTDISALRDQISSVVGGAQFNGLSLLSNQALEAGSGSVRVLASLDRSSDGVVASDISVAKQDMGTNSAAIAAGATALATADNQVGGFGDAAAAALTGAATPPTGTTTIATSASDAIDAGVGFNIQISATAGDAPSNTAALDDIAYVARDGDTAADVAAGLAKAFNDYVNADMDDPNSIAAVANGNQVVFTGSTTGNSFSVNVNSYAATETTIGGRLADIEDIDVTTQDGADQALDVIEGLIQIAIDSSAAFGSAQMRLETQAEFVTGLTDALKSGIGSMVDADMEEASARLQALQVQQQLGVQALSIANQAPQALLSLFR